GAFRLDQGAAHVAPVRGCDGGRKRIRPVQGLTGAGRRYVQAWRRLQLRQATKKPRHRCRGFALLKPPERLAQKSMPPMPPPPGGMPAPAAFFFGSSATMASVVISSAATEAAFWIAARTTLVGSMMPFEIRLTYSPVCESKPQEYWSFSRVLPTLKKP